MSLADELRKLMQLHAEGGLTDQEFTEAKAAVTQQTASGASAQNTKVSRADPVYAPTAFRGCYSSCDSRGESR